jgi:hypothetical protein
VPAQRNVLLVVVDAASPRVFCPAVQTGRLKHLQRLADAGEMHQASVSIFPSITPAATASIITGAYPATHGIVGASWYDDSTDQIAYYGDDFWVIASEGFGAFLRDFLVHLNGDRLTAPTLFERVEQAGLEAACLNYLVFRGLKTHQVNVPWLLAMLPGTPITETVKGPTTLCLGDFVSDGRKHAAAPKPYGPLHRFGMDDAGTASVLCELAAQQKLPPFTVAYFADNDYRSHEVGPYEALPVLDRVDAALGDAFDAAGGLERFLSHTAVIVTSDHGHCDVLEDEDAAVVKLDDVLNGFRQARLGSPWRDRDEIMICPNMRAAQVYVRDRQRIADVVRAARQEPRIDLIIRRDDTAETARYRVSGAHGDVTFWSSGGEWRSDGDPLPPDDYPNAFERMAGALDADAAGDVWVTVRPGCEFAARGGRPHVGGASHGALHALDSLSPVVCAGVPFRLPRALRSIDLAGLCLRALGLPAEVRSGRDQGRVPHHPRRVGRPVHSGA